MDLVRGAVDPRGSYVSKILHVKTKESGPVGGARPPRSANGNGLSPQSVAKLIRFDAAANLLC